jgi:hypothetical protein
MRACSAAHQSLMWKDHMQTHEKKREEMAKR